MRAYDTEKVHTSYTIFDDFYRMNYYGLARYFYFFYLCNRKAAFGIMKASFHCVYLYCSSKSKY